MLYASASQLSSIVGNDFEAPRNALMEQCKPLYSEEDIRTKIVAVWLVNHGFGPSDVSVEYSFEIRLGRKILSIDSDKPEKNWAQIFRPRADVLVRGFDGRNLLIVEVKAPDEPLDDDVREQGICYARLLRKGGVAPFVILTNAYETKIYDTITEESINGKECATLSTISTFRRV